MAERNGLFWINLILFILIVAAYLHPLPYFSVIRSNIWVHYLAGFALLGLIIGQWDLFVKRAIRKKATRTDVFFHTLYGSFSIVMFFLHSLSLGYKLLFVLSILFLTTTALGTFNRKTIPLTSNKAIIIWYAAHVLVAAMMVPLIVFHLYTIAWFRAP